jgi:hypothetical protein
MVFGENDDFYTDFKTKSKYLHDDSVKKTRGILKAIWTVLNGGWAESTRNKFSAEIFDDYLEMAEYLNEQNFYIAATVIAGTTLEEKIRQLCIKHKIKIEIEDKQGNKKPINVETLNGKLKDLYSDGKNDVKLVTQNYGLRNDAAHGKWNNDTSIQKQHRLNQVKNMISEIKHFIKTNSL